MPRTSTWAVRMYSTNFVRTFRSHRGARIFGPTVRGSVAGVGAGAAGGAGCSGAAVGVGSACSMVVTEVSSSVTELVDAGLQVGGHLGERSEERRVGGR